MDDTAKKYQEVLDKYAAEVKKMAVPDTTPTGEVARAPLEPPVAISSPEPKVAIAPPAASTPIPPRIETLSTPQLPTGGTPRIVKVLFNFSLILFFVILLGIGYNFYRSMAIPSATDNPIVSAPTVAPTKPVMGETCLVNDKNYKVGETFSAADGCNTCSCGTDLTVSCTEKACDVTPQPTVKVSSTPTTKVTSSLKTTPSPVSTIKADPLSVAREYLDAYVKADWTKVKELMADKNFDEQIAAGYELVSYKVISSKYDTDKRYYHVYINLTDKSGKTFKVVPPNTPLSVLMINSEGEWKALTWYFFQ